MHGDSPAVRKPSSAASLRDLLGRAWNSHLTPEALWKKDHTPKEIETMQQSRQLLEAQNPEAGQGEISPKWNFAL